MLDDDKIEDLKKWPTDFNAVQADYYRIADYLMPEKLRLLEEGDPVPDFTNISEKFGLDGATTLTDVKHLIDDLNQFHAYFESDYEFFILLEYLQSSVKYRFSATPQDLKQMALFIEIAFELPDESVKYIHERFNNDNIDKLRAYPIRNYYNATN